MKVTLWVSNERLQKIKSLAERRYGNTEQESIDKVIQDAVQWKLDYWQKYEPDLIERLWLLFACVIKLPWLSKLAWGELIGPYFD